MDSFDITTATPAAGHDQAPAAPTIKAISGSQTQAVDNKTDAAPETCPCCFPAQANTALTTDGFKNDVPENEEPQQQQKQQQGKDELTAATTTTGADGVDAIVEGNDQQQKKNSDAAAAAKTSDGEHADEKAPKSGKLQSMLRRLKKGSDEGSEAHGEGEESRKAKPAPKAETDAQ